MHPVYVIENQGNLLTPTVHERPALAVFSSSSKAKRFIREFGVFGKPVLVTTVEELIWSEPLRLDHKVASLGMKFL